jgi:hypothetical protein
MSRAIAAIALGIGLLLLALTGPLAGEDSRSEPLPVEQNLGKIMLIYAGKKEDGKSASGWVQNPRMRTVGNRLFIGGELPTKPNGDRPFEGMTMWYPVSDVVYFYEFDDTDAVVRYYEGRERSRRANDDSR